MVSLDEIGNYISFGFSVIYLIYILYTYRHNINKNITTNIFLIVSIICAIIIIFIFVCDVIEASFINDNSFIQFEKYGKINAQLLLAISYGYFIGVSRC